MVDATEQIALCANTILERAHLDANVNQLYIALFVRYARLLDPEMDVTLVRQGDPCMRGAKST